MMEILLPAVLAMALMLLFMPRFLPFLKRLKFGQTIYELGPQAHKSKMGTPNMGGVLIGGFTVMASLIAAAVTAWTGGAALFALDSPLYAMLFVCLGSMAIGFLDDYIKDVKKRHDGLSPRQKIMGQVVVGLLFSTWCYFLIGSDVILPFTHTTWDLGFMYIPLMTLLVIFMTNSANLQDGVDGILSSVTVVGMAAFGLMAALIGVFSDTSLNAQVTGTVRIVAFALLGACLGFLRFNRYPAKIFMGDTGSMFIGGAMVGVAMLLKCEFLLLLICFTCVMSSVSVIMQTTYFKLTHGKRIFKMSPIHHHFELCGMKENQIVVMYVLVTLLLSALAVWSLSAWL